MWKLEDHQFPHCTMWPESPVRVVNCPGREGPHLAVQQEGWVVSEYTCNMVSRAILRSTQEPVIFVSNCPTHPQGQQRRCLPCAQTAGNRKELFLCCPRLPGQRLRTQGCSLAEIPNSPLCTHDISASFLFVCRIPEAGKCPFPAQRHPVI